MTEAVLLHLVERDTWERALSDGRTALERDLQSVRVS